MRRLVIFAILMVPAIALAQTSGPRSAPPVRSGQRVAPPAPAIPGTRAPTAAAPRGDRELPPTEALFDAINRGDINDVRAALARGARTDVRNALGATPVEQAVDLGRSDIALLLLSLRGAAPTMRPQEAERPGRTTEPPMARPSRTARPVATPPAEPVRARLWANDGGSPQPDIGFLGFDASRTAAAPRRGR